MLEISKSTCVHRGTRLLVSMTLGLMTLLASCTPLLANRPSEIIHDMSGPIIIDVKLLGENPRAYGALSFVVSVSTWITKAQLGERIFNPVQLSLELPDGITLRSGPKQWTAAVVPGKATQQEISVLVEKLSGNITPIYFNIFWTDGNDGSVTLSGKPAIYLRLVDVSYFEANWNDPLFGAKPTLEPNVGLAPFTPVPPMESPLPIVVP